MNVRGSRGREGEGGGGGGMSLHALAIVLIFGGSNTRSSLVQSATVERMCTRPTCPTNDSQQEKKIIHSRHTTHLKAQFIWFDFFRLPNPFSPFLHRPPPTHPPSAHFLIHPGTSLTAKAAIGWLHERGTKFRCSHATSGYIIIIYFSVPNTTHTHTHTCTYLFIYLFI
jgi:hypothetical protein